MSSIYDAPRQAPVPTISNRVSSAPVVPEVSMICQQNLKTASPYNQWKMQNKSTFRHSVFKNNKENIPSNIDNQDVHRQTCMLKKQVRFDGATVPQKQNLNLRTMESKTENSLIGVRFTPPPIEDHNSSNFPNLQGKTFEEIYMANIPNRHLDISIIEPQNSVVPKTASRKENIEQIKNCKPISPIQNNAVRRSNSPKSYKEFRTQADRNLNLRETDCINDILNYRSPARKTDSFIKRKYDFSATNRKSQLPSVNYQSMNSSSKAVRNNHDLLRQTVQKCDNSTQTSCDGMEKQSYNEPTLTDLLKIIQQQNEQITQLQKQILNLQKPNTLQIESASHNSHENCNRINPTISNNIKPNMPTFSIDLMRTSFEVSFRPQQNVYHRKHKEFVINEPKIQEVTESDTLSSCEKNRNELSLNLNESLHVRENCPSPEPSIKINMEDYCSSENDEDDVSSDVGATFYNNLMGQINNILKTAQMHSDTDCDERRRKLSTENKTMNKVKEATLKHLKSIGIDLPSFDDSDCTDNQLNDCNPNEVSFAVKQLLMKYLPDDHLVKIDKQKQNDGKIDKGNLIPTRPEFSFASIQYMKKYNLLKSDEEKRQRFPESANNQQKAPKILDITALKLQPKLL